MSFGSRRDISTENGPSTPTESKPAPKELPEAGKPTMNLLESG